MPSQTPVSPRWNTVTASRVTRVRMPVTLISAPSRVYRTSPAARRQPVKMIWEICSSTITMIQREIIMPISMMCSSRK